MEWLPHLLKHPTEDISSSRRRVRLRNATSNATTARTKHCDAENQTFSSLTGLPSRAAWSAACGLFGHFTMVVRKRGRRQSN
jgi:hypothetical protein